jgi:hypothetical protein
MRHLQGATARGHTHTPLQRQPSTADAAKAAPDRAPTTATTIPATSAGATISRAPATAIATSAAATTTAIAIIIIIGSATTIAAAAATGRAHRTG